MVAIHIATTRSLSLNVCTLDAATRRDIHYPKSDMFAVRRSTVELQGTRVLGLIHLHR